MKHIPLWHRSNAVRGRGLYVIVDDEDFEELSRFKWSVHVCKKKHTTRLYARRVTADNKTIHMHRVVAGAPDDRIVDHRDSNGLNNCRANLRVCTNAKNMLNAKSHADATSRFKGVCWDASREKWTARFRGDFLGRFEKEEMAAVAYDAAAERYDAEYSLTNRELEGAC
jgi:hypothetical protein